MISSRRSNRGHVWTLLLFAVVMLLMLVAIVFGVRVYDAATRANAATTQLRAVEGYLSSALKATDENNAVSVAAGPQGELSGTDNPAVNADVEFVTGSPMHASVAISSRDTGAGTLYTADITVSDQAGSRPYTLTSEHYVSDGTEKGGAR